MKIRFKLTACALSMAVAQALAAPPLGTPYYTDGQYSFVEDATSRGIGQVNMIACYMSAMKPAALVNQGNYLALVDEKKCDQNNRSSTSNQNAGGGAQAPKYTPAVVNSTRASNTDPMLSSIWISSEFEAGMRDTIFVGLRATSAPSNANPYGVFRLDYCGKSASAAASASCMMKGYVDASSSGVQYFANEAMGANSNLTQLVLTQGSGGDTGQGRLAESQTFNGTTSGAEFSFAYNSTHYRRTDTASSSDLCFSRLESDAKKSVWRYGLYKEDGTPLNINSGFPVRWTDPSDSQTYQGQISYYGLWMESSKSSVVPNGATLSKLNFGSNAAPETFTLSKARGRLTKHTRQTTKLDRITNVRINVGLNVNGQWQQTEIYWNGTQFVKSGVMSCGQNGCNTASLNPVVPIDNASWAQVGGIFGHSQSLGGELFIRDIGNLGSPSQVDVAYRVQSLVYPSDFPAQLQCLGGCADLASMTAYFTNQAGITSPFTPLTQNSQFNPMGVPTATLVSYTQEGSSGELRATNDNAPLVLTNPSWLDGKPEYRHGFRLGKLFSATDASAVLCEGSSTHYCGSKLNDLPIFYTWETGVESFNQFFALRASSGNCAGSSDAYCRFDPPLSVTFSVPNDNTNFGEYAGRDLVLQYGGYGNLWGVPGLCVNRLNNAPADCSLGGQNTRFVPAFVIPFDTTQGVVRDGSTPYYVKWLDREIRFSQVASGQCAGLAVPGAGLALPQESSFLNPGVAGSPNYIGTMPTVTATPRVVDGEVKY